MKIEQTKYGLQPKPYADHEYEWKITLEDGEQMTEEIAREIVHKEPNLRVAMPRYEYWKQYRDQGRSFEEHMNTVCAGYYYFSPGDTVNEVILSARQEYID